MFKDEAGGKQIVEFVDLKAKLYSYKMLDGAEDKKYKGVTKKITKRCIEFDDYRQCLFSRKNNTEKLMSYEVIVMRFIPKKLIKLPSDQTMTNELLWQTEYRPWLTYIQT